MKTEPFRKTAFAFALILALNAASVSADICLDPPGPKADIWFDCWDCPYQCHGDADCQAQGGFIKYRVYINDLAIIQAVAQAAYLGYGNWPARYSQDFNYDPRADFDRDLDVDDCDVDILEHWYGNRSVPGDCPGRPPADPLTLQPLEDDVLFTGHSYTIHWEEERAGGCGAHRYMLYYSTDAGENWLPVDTNSVDYTCSYEWLIPPVVSDQCLLRIDDLHDPTAVTDTLDEFFTIVECSSSNILSVQTPDAGQFVIADSNCTITWSDCRSIDSCGGSYKLYYSTDNGENWLPVDTNSIDNACWLEWHVPDANSDQALVRVEDADNPDINDVTDGAFYIYECQEAFAGDIDKNCYVDFRDFAMLVPNWSLDPDFRLIVQLAEQWCDCGNPYDPACGY